MAVTRPTRDKILLGIRDQGFRFFCPRLAFWNTQYITSIPFIHDCSVAADVRCITLRDGGKSHFENPDGRAQEMHHVCSADSLKYKT